MKQPLLGIVATFLVIGAALGFISLIDFPTFTTWVSYLLQCLIPMQIVIGVIWGTNRPAFAARQSQPVKGILLMLVTVLTGAIVAPVYLRVAGGNATPPSPMLIHATIVSIAATFWAAVTWGGWPFKTILRNETVAGLAMLIFCYAATYLVQRIFFDYGFMQGAPVYVASLDPHGMFMALNALVFLVTTLIGVFMLAAFDLWPLTKAPALMKQPVLGLVWSAISLSIAAVTFWIGVVWMQIDVMTFLVRLPVPYIFGTIVVLNMLQNSLFGKLTQPLKGIANVTAVLVIGSALAQVYRTIAPSISGTLHAGPPTYDLEIWTATALLGVTFPLLIFFAEFFRFWPLARTD